MIGQNPGSYQDLTGDVIPLSEAAFRPDGTFPVKIIGEGWGSSGYYSKKVLSEAAGNYKKGTQMFINHPTRSEIKERPERDLHQLAAYFVNESAVWKDDGTYGPGLYQEAKALPNYAEFLKEAAPVIGVSHYVLGKAKQGEAAGRTGPIIEKIGDVISVDFVTVPGAKGSIGAMFESWRGREAQFNTSDSLSSRISAVRSAIQDKFKDPAGEVYPYVLDVFDDFAVVEIGDRKVVVPYSIDKTGETPRVILGDAQDVEQVYQTKESEEMPDADIVTESRGDWLARVDRLKEAETKNQELARENERLVSENATLKESLAKTTEKSILAEAGAYATELLEKADLPELAKNRIKESLIKQAGMKDGVFDRDAFRNLAEAAIKSEREYLGSVTGTGAVRGMGGSANTGTTLEESRKTLVESYIRSGMSKETAESLVMGMI